MTTPLSEERLAEMRERCDKATPGPWDYDHMHFEIHAPHDDNYWVVVSEECNVPNDAPVDQFGHQYSPDYEFIAAARTDMPDLLDEVERLRSWLRECSVAMGGDGSDDSLLGLVYCCGAGNEALKQIGREQAEADRLRALLRRWVELGPVLVASGHAWVTLLMRDTLKALEATNE